MKFIIKSSYGTGWSTSMPTAELAQFVATEPEFVHDLERAIEARDNDETLSFTDIHYGDVMKPDHPAMIKLLGKIEKRFGPKMLHKIRYLLEMSCGKIRVAEAVGVIKIKEFDGNESWSHVDSADNVKYLVLGTSTNGH